MFSSIMKLFKIEVVIVAIVVFFAIVALWRWAKGYKGTYSRSYFYDPLMSAGRSTFEGYSLGSRDFPASIFAKPRKRESAGETECRRVMESLFHKPFPNKRPDFMKNSITGANLELDCFNEELRLAVEYHGRQHYEYIPRFHPHGKQSFYNQKYRDKETKELCAKHGIHLIEVPYKVPVQNIRGFLIKKLRERGLI